MLVHEYEKWLHLDETRSRKSQIKGKESENSYQELKRTQKDRHTQTHGNCIEISYYWVGINSGDI